MSRASIQSLAILSISAGAIKSIQNNCIISRVDCKKELAGIYNEICHTINKWPETGDGHKNTAAITNALKQWSELEYTITPQNKTAVLLATCQRAMVDLYERLRNNQCRKMVESILGHLSHLWNVYGKDGAMFSVWDESGMMVDKLQEIVGW